jgi:hypothetical protein
VSSSLRRGTLAATVLALSVASLSACSAGSNAPTEQIQPDNAMTQVKQIKIQDVQVITTGMAGGQATITGRVFNNADRAETLKSITLGGSMGGVTLHPAKGKSLQVPAHGWLTLGGKHHASAVIDDPKAAGIKNGEAQKVVFHLSRTGAVSLRGLVVPVEHGLQRFGPSPAPSAPSVSPSGTQSGTPTGKPSKSPQQSPGASTGPGTNTVTPTANPGSGVGTPQS